MFSSRFMPCAHCGASVERSTVHECDGERLADYQMFGLRENIATFDTLLSTYLHTAAGRFEVWLAARQVRTPAP